MVLPAPFAPTKPVTPDGTDRSSPSSALVDGNSITKPRVSMIAGIHPILAASTRPSEHSSNTRLRQDFRGASLGNPDANGDLGRPSRRRMNPLRSVTDAPTPTPTADDGDGVAAMVEGGAPNGGDGNRDGLDDSRQSNVASLPAAVDVNGNGASMTTSRSCRPTARRSRMCAHGGFRVTTPHQRG